jgi:hypothetical protein
MTKEWNDAPLRLRRRPFRGRGRDVPSARFCHGHASIGHYLDGPDVAAGGGLIRINEPLNPQHPPGGFPGILDAAEHRFQYIC